MGRKSRTKRLGQAGKRDKSPAESPKLLSKGSKGSPKSAEPKNTWPRPLSIPSPVKATESILAPSSESDPRCLGKGKAKLVWLERTDENMDRARLPRLSRVVVNAFDEQLFRRGTGEEILKAKMAVQQNEFEFTRMVHDLLPEMIPRVYDIERGIAPQPRFRYYKDRCEHFQVNEALFPIMIQMIDRLIEQGWVYLDMKPGNIGELDGRPVLVDTDPCFFYQIPPQPTPREDASIRRSYRISCHLIVVLFCLNHAETIPTSVLKQFMDDNRYTVQTLLRVYRTSPIPKNTIEDYNNERVDRTQYQVVFTKIVEPVILLAHYGTYKQTVPKLESKNQLTEITLNPEQRLEQLFHQKETV